MAYLISNKVHSELVLRVSYGKCSGLTVGALVSGLSSPGSRLGRVPCWIVFLGKTRYSHSASLHPVVQMGTGEINAGGNPALDQYPIHTPGRFMSLKRGQASA